MWWTSSIDKIFRVSISILFNINRFNKVKVTLKTIKIVFIFSQFDWICCDGTEGVCMYVCMYVCMCVTALQPKRMDGFWWNFPQMIWQIFVRFVFLRFWNFKRMTSWRPFLHFSLGHSHSRNFAPIFFKIGGEVESCLPLFAIENQRDRSVTSANMADRVLEKKSKWPPKLKFLKQGKWGV